MDNSDYSGVNPGKPYPINNNSEPNSPPVSPQSVLTSSAPTIQYQTPITPIIPPIPPAPDNSNTKRIIIFNIVGAFILFFIFLVIIIFSSLETKNTNKQAVVIPTATPIILENTGVVTPTVTPKKQKEATSQTVTVTPNPYSIFRKR